MDFAVLVPTKIDDVGYVVHAENLGYKRAWVADSQMIWGDVYAYLALAAQRTRKIMLGTGVAIPGTRIAPVTATSIATINRLAPGRTMLGMGTGNTAMSLMGQQPYRIKDFALYLRQVRDLLDGKEIQYTYQGVTKPIQILMQEARFVNLEQRIPMMISAFGPKGQSLAGEICDGLIISLPRGGPLSTAMERVRAGARKAGRTLKNFYTGALVTLVILEPGEQINSERVVRDFGPSIFAVVHYVYDKVTREGGDPPDYVKSIWKQYANFVKNVPESHRHIALHHNHYMWLDPEEARMITPELIKATCVVGRVEEVREQLQELERQGLQEIMFAPPISSQYRVIENVARNLMEKM